MNLADRLQTTDVVCAGGGPAGLAAAIALRLRGLHVVLADASVPPVDKACGEGLMPDGVGALRALGVFPERRDHAIFRGIRFVGPQGSVEAHFPSGHGIGMRRTVLHEALRRRAEEIGVEMRWGARLTGIAPGTALVNQEAIETKWIVGADGQNSRIRGWAGLSRSPRKSFSRERVSSTVAGVGPQIRARGRHHRLIRRAIGRDCGLRTGRWEDGHHHGVHGWAG